MWTARSVRARERARIRRLILPLLKVVKRQSLDRVIATTKPPTPLQAALKAIEQATRAPKPGRGR